MISATKLSLAKKEFIEWSLQCACHCYPKIFQYKNKCIKTLYFMILILFSYATGFLIKKNVDEYYNNEVVSKIQIIDEAPTYYPTITICSLNKLRTKSLKKIIKKCVFNQLPCDLDQDFSVFDSFAYYNCLQFNSGYNMSNNTVPLKTTTFQGEKHGLILLVGPLFDQLINSDSKGLKIYIHNQTTVPGLFDNPISVPTGQRTFIAMRKTFVHDYPYPYSNCEDLNNYDSDEFKRCLQTGKKYRQQNCIDFCYQEMIVDKCKCFFPGIPNLPMKNIKPCENIEETECYTKKIDEFNVRINEFKTKCSKGCPLECDSMKYDFELSNLYYPRRDFFDQFILANERADYAENFNETLTFDLYKENNLILSVYFTSTQYTEITQSPKITLIDLIPNLGGTIGIWLGLSLFFIIEVLEIFVRLFFIFISKTENLTVKS